MQHLETAHTDTVHTCEDWSELDYLFIYLLPSLPIICNMKHFRGNAQTYYYNNYYYYEYQYCNMLWPKDGMVSSTFRGFFSLKKRKLSLTISDSNEAKRNIILTCYRDNILLLTKCNREIWHSLTWILIQKLRLLHFQSSINQIGAKAQTKLAAPKVLPVQYLPLNTH